MAEPRRSCGPIELCRRIGNPPPGVPPGDDAQDGAIRIFGVINALSDKRRFGNAFATRRKLLSGDDGELPNHQPPRTPEPFPLPPKKSILIFSKREMLNLIRNMIFSRKFQFCFVHRNTFVQELARELCFKYNEQETHQNNYHQDVYLSNFCGPCLRRWMFCVGRCANLVY